MAGELASELRVFGSQTGTPLVDWLDQLEARARAGHFELFERTYGLDWLRPHRGIAIER
jgi:hypothetical protein